MARAPPAGRQRRSGGGAAGAGGRQRTPSASHAQRTVRTPGGCVLTLIQLDPAATPARAMADLARVQAWLEDGSLKHTLDPQTPNTVDLARFIALANGAPREELPAAGPARPEAEAVLQRAIGAVAPHFLFVLLDGMGMNLLESTLPPTSFLRRHLVQPMHSVFPATTTAALNSLASGVHPSSHGLPGWTIRTTSASTGAELTATPLPFVEDVAGSFGSSLSTAGVQPEELFLAPPIYSLYRRPAFQVSAYAGTEFSDYSTGWCPSSKPDSAADAMVTIAERWKSQEHGEGSFTYWYNAEPDSSSHKFGWKSDNVTEELIALDAALESLWAETADLAADGGGGRTIVVTADHGHLECHGDETMLLGDHPEDAALTDLLRCSPTVEPRTPGFHVADGSSAEAFAVAFRSSRFSEKFALLSADEAEALEIFGPAPMGDRCKRHIGDFVAIAAESVVIMSKVADMVGQHGGATPAEMQVPLIVASDLKAASGAKL